MQTEDAKILVLYMADTRRQLREIDREAAELNDAYDTLRGAAMDGMPHGATVSDGVGRQAAYMADLGAGDRLRELEVRAQVLKADAAAIRCKVDRLWSVYKILIMETLAYGHSWQRAARMAGYSVSHSKRLREDGLRKLAALLDEAPMAGEILARARDARD